ncbi:methyltransferase domain-containing protein, partial [Candidatus Dependentiae bacterium]
FDIVVSFFAFHYISDAQKVLNKIFQLLSPGGQLIIKTAGGNTKAIEEIFELPEWANQFTVKENNWHAMASSEYKKKLEKLGFAEIEAKTVHKTRTFKNTQEFVNYAVGWIPFVTGLSGEKAIELAHALAKNLKKHMSANFKNTENVDLVTPIASIKAQKPI